LVALVVDDQNWNLGERQLLQQSGKLREVPAVLKDRNQDRALASRVASPGGQAVSDVTLPRDGGIVLVEPASIAIVDAEILNQPVLGRKRGLKALLTEELRGN
jgi:hypothetical protein